jgi:uncharacterized Zn finger protein (UPF0148 family)
MNTPYHGYPFGQKSFCIDCGTQKRNDGYLVCPSCNEIRKHLGEDEDARDQEQTTNDILSSFHPA